MACGKSTVAKLLHSLTSFPVIDADAIAKQALDPGGPAYHETVVHFGNSILDQNGYIDRKELGRIVFSDKEKRLWLESVIHPYVQSQVAQWRLYYEKLGHCVAFYDVPLLFEKKIASQFDSILLVACTPETQLARALMRDQLPEVEIRKRIDHQLPVEHKISQSHYIIWNHAHTTLGELEIEVKMYLKWLTGQFKLKSRLLK
jgi:dephospho-CoA kinase